MKKYLAKKIEGYLLEPLFDKVGATWQAHHVTNPAAFRPSFDDKVYLGYRAGGDRDHYCIGNVDVWSSSLGLAILNEFGDKVLYRFTYPIMKINRKVALPQSEQEYPDFLEKHATDLCVMHDFRLYEHGDYIYVIYHDGQITKAFDCVKRMKSLDFKRRVDESIALMNSGRAGTDIVSDWSAIWWIDEAWENAGVDGTRLIYPADNNKNDIIFYLLSDGKLMVNHRPLPDIANTYLDYCIAVKKTKDGFSNLGTLETCVRPGCFDNSHVGANGMPAIADINGVKVYIDVCHGVHNKTLCSEGEFKWEMMYLSYFRVRDFETGELLYYSEEPILEMDNVWREYTENGRWIKLIPHLHIVFTGGQVEVIKGKNGLDDDFVFYNGVGDTAITRGIFKIRDLLPEKVVEDISNRKSKHQVITSINENSIEFPRKISGWKWEICNNIERRCVAVKRFLIDEKSGDVFDFDMRSYSCRPGYFDSDMLILDKNSLQFSEKYGWISMYKGIRWDIKDGYKITEIGFGILVLDRDNPEKLLYRSTHSVTDVVVMEGWTDGMGIEFFDPSGKRPEDYIPSQVGFEIVRSVKLINEGRHWQSHHTLWLQKRSALLNG